MSFLTLQGCDTGFEQCLITEIGDSTNCQDYSIAFNRHQNQQTTER
jgi:hypothetical protein